MSAFTKRLTSNYSLETQPTAPRCTVLSNRLLRILGTAWREAAMLTQERAQDKLISPYEGEKYFLHT